MKLITSAEIQTIKSFFTRCRTKLSNFLTRDLIVGILFFIIWCRLLSSAIDLINPILVIIPGLIIPFVLLVKVVQYKNRLAYASVQVVFIFMLFINLANSIFYTHLYLTNSVEFYWLDSGCIECDIVYCIELMICCLVALSIMHNRKMVHKYDWNVTWFYRTLLVALFLILIAGFVIPIY